MDVGELVDVVVDHLLRLGDASPEQLVVRAHRDGAAEEHGAVVPPKEVMERLLRGVEEGLAILRTGLGGETQVYLYGLGDYSQPFCVVVVVVPVEHPGKLDVRLGRGLKLLVRDLELPPLVEGIPVEIEERL